MSATHCMAMTTTGSPATARDLARAVVEARLAACVQIVAIDSVYRWRDGIEESAEALLLMKTRGDRYDELEAFVAERHEYDVPEVVRVPLEGGLAAYLGWIDDSTG
jgi:periplasmic divalent cation tolerance protein